MLLQERYAPSDVSVIHLTGYNSIKELVDYIKYLDSNDTAYEEYRQYKHQGISNAWLRDTLNQRPWDTDFDVTRNYNNAKGIRNT